MCASTDVLLFVNITNANIASDLLVVYLNSNYVSLTISNQVPSSYIENNNASNKTRRYLKAANQRQIMLVKTGNQKNKKMLKVNNRNNRKSCEICTNLTIKITEQRH